MASEKELRAYLQSIDREIKRHLSEHESVVSHERIVKKEICGETMHSHLCMLLDPEVGDIYGDPYCREECMYAQLDKVSSDTRTVFDCEGRPSYVTTVTKHYSCHGSQDPVYRSIKRENGRKKRKRR